MLDTKGYTHTHTHTHTRNLVLLLCNSGCTSAPQYYVTMACLSCLHSHRRKKKSHYVLIPTLPESTKTQHSDVTSSDSQFSVYDNGITYSSQGNCAQLMIPNVSPEGHFVSDCVCAACYILLSWNSVNRNSLLLGNLNYRYPNSPPQTAVNKQWRHIGVSLYCVREYQLNAAFRDKWLLNHRYKTDGAGEWWMINWKGFRRKWSWPN